MLPSLILLLGKSGSGKSTQARYLSRTARRVLAHNPNGEVYGPEWTATADRRELIELLADPGACRINWTGAAVARSERERMAAFEFANRCAWACGNLTIVWDEVDTFTGDGLTPIAYRIVNAGRHRGLRVLACSRRPFRVPRDLSANATRIIVFRMTEPRDVAYLRSIAGESADVLPTLWRFQALDWTEYGSVIRMAPFD